MLYLTRTGATTVGDVAYVTGVITEGDRVPGVFFDGASTDKNVATGAAWSSLGAGTTVTTGVVDSGKTWTRIVQPGTGNGARLTMALADLVGGELYTISALVRNESSVNPASFTLDWADGGGPTITLDPGEERVISGTVSRATYDATFRFLDFERSGSTGMSILITDLLIESWPEVRPFYSGTSSPWAYTWTGTANNSASTQTYAGTVPATSLVVERRVNDGEWVMLSTNVAVGADFVDPLPSPKGDNEYRVTSVSATPSYSQSSLIITSNGEGEWVYLNYGPAFASLLRTRSQPEISAISGREKAGHRYVGRRKPVGDYGEARSYEVSVGAQLVHEAAALSDDFPYDSSPAEWEEAGREAETVAYRDFTGRRIFGILGDVGTSEVLPGLATVGFRVEESDFTEAYGA
jgi:hypothetical protein